MLEEKAAKIKLLILDVDGVMTNGHIMINDRGEEIKYFNVKDGQGLKLLIKAGIDVVFVSGRRSKALAYRAEDLGIREVHQGVDDKETLCKKLIQQKRLKREQVCCMGDDLPDLSMFNQVGITIAVADAVAEVREAANLVTKNRGGNGAVREVCEWILKAQKRWPDMISSFMGEGN